MSSSVRSPLNGSMKAYTVAARSTTSSRPCSVLQLDRAPAEAQEAEQRRPSARRCRSAAGWRRSCWRWRSRRTPGPRRRARRSWRPRRTPAGSAISASRASASPWEKSSWTDLGRPGQQEGRPDDGDAVGDSLIGSASRSAPLRAMNTPGTMSAKAAYCGRTTSREGSRGASSWASSDWGADLGIGTSKRRLLRRLGVDHHHRGFLMIRAAVPRTRPQNARDATARTHRLDRLWRFRVWPRTDAAADPPPADRLEPGHAPPLGGTSRIEGVALADDGATRSSSSSPADRRSIPRIPARRHMSAGPRRTRAIQHSSTRSSSTRHRGH